MLLPKIFRLLVFVPWFIWNVYASRSAVGTFQVFTQTESVTCVCAPAGNWSTDIYQQDSICYNIRPVECLPLTDCKGLPSSETQVVTCPPAPAVIREMPYCGDSICEYTENCSNCIADCAFETRYLSCNFIQSC